MEAVSVLVWYTWKAEAEKIQHARHETMEAKSETRDVGSGEATFMPLFVHVQKEHQGSSFVSHLRP